MDSDRQLVHTRRITCRAFRLGNGDMEIEATLTDEKDQEVAFRSRPPVPAGGFMHRMALTLTVDCADVIQAVKAQTRQAPWPMCGGVDIAYRGLIGLRIGAGFTLNVRKLLGGIKGCTHLTELLFQAANAYMQASWPDRVARQVAVDPDPRHWPDKTALSFVNQCHAWSLDGQTMAQEYPELVPPTVRGGS